MEPKSWKQYQQRFDNVVQAAAEWKTNWKDISDYLYPRHGAFLANDDEEQGKGEKKGQKIINTHASLSRQVCGAGIMSGLSSASKPWFRMGLADDELMELKPVRIWLHDVTKVLTDIFAKSNFYTSMRNLYSELCAFGFNVVIIEEDFDKIIRCRPTTIGECFVTLDSQYRPDTLYRKFWLSLSQVIDKYCPKGADGKYSQRNADGTGVSDSVWAAWEGTQNESGSDRREEKYLIYNVIEPRKVRDPNDLGPKGMPYASMTWMVSGGDDQFLKISGYTSKPFIAPRWEVTGTDTYGDCPGMGALSEVKQLQLMETDKLLAIELEVKPPMNAPSSMADQALTQLPGGVNFYDPQSGQQGMTPTHMVRSNLQNLGLTLQQVEQRIDRHFFVQLFLSVLGEAKQLTAAETYQRIAEKVQQLGPVIERLETEALDEAIDRAYTIADDAGMFPPPPEEILDMEIKPEYISLLAQAQKLAGTTSIEAFAGFVAQVAAVKGDALDKVDWDEMIDQYAALLGVPPELVRTDDVVSEMRAAAAAQAAAQQQMESGMEIANGAKLLSEAKMDSPSALTAMAGGI